METAMRNVSINDHTSPMSPIIKTEAVPQDQPLDFSKRVRHSIEDDSIRKVSEDSAVSDLIDQSPSITPASQPSADDNHQHLIGEPRVSVPSINSFLPQTTMAGMGMFYPGAPVFPNFMPPAFPPMWANPMAAAAMMQQQQEAARKLLQQTSSPKQLPTTVRSFGASRPFPGKDSLGIAAGLRFPTMPTAGLGHPNPVLANSMIPDPGVLAEALKSHEEMFNAYKQQVLNQKASEEAKRVRRPVSSTVTNGNHSNSCLPASTVVMSAESSSTEDVNDDNSTLNDTVPISQSNTVNGCSTENFLPESMATSVNTTEDDQLSHRISSQVEDMLPSSTANTQSLHSSDESIPSTSDGQRSLTPAHSSCGDVSDNTGMRPRSSTLPTQSDCRMLSYSPAPSHLSNGNNSSGPGTPNSKGSFRKRARTLPDDQKDEAYWERRRKNNEAAKRSRDSRRAKEDEIAIRAAFLEQENIRLRVELAALRQQTAKLRSELIIIQGPEEQERQQHSPAEGS